MRIPFLHPQCAGGGFSVYKRERESMSELVGLSLNLDDPFESAVAELVEMNRRKRRDYAVDGDPFSNFRETSDHFGLSGWESAEFNLAQKMFRLKSLRANGRMDEPENESVGDTYLDAAVYAVIMYALYRKFAWSGEK